MTDFVRRILRPENPDWIIRSLSDVDFYKFTMGYFIFRHYRGVNVTFRLINRNKEIPLAKVIDEDELRTQLDHVCTLVHKKTHLYYLRGMDVYGKNMFSEEYLEFLGQLKLSKYTLKRVGDQFELEFKGPWEVVTFWETIALAIISELYYRSLMRRMSEPELKALYAGATDKLYVKLRLVKQFPDIRFLDFGQRRRHSYLWQNAAVGMGSDLLPRQFMGTSNTKMAFEHDLVPGGTFAHETYMVLAALADTPEEMLASQYVIPEKWQEVYGKGLRICLPDTYGSSQFLHNAPAWLATDWRGFRQDSGDPVKFGYSVIGWYRKHGVDPRERLVIFSDGLDVKTMIRLSGIFQGEIGVAFGWGTLFTNDFIDCHPEREVVVPEFGKTWGELFRPFSLVCKVSEVNGRPAVKLSDNIAKATGPKKEIARYAKIFGREGRVDEKVLV